VSKQYQNTDADPSGAMRLAVPETVSVAMAEIAADLRDGLLTLAVGTGLQVMATMMEVDVTAVAGPRGRPTRTGWRCGTGPSAARGPWVGGGCR
jgi:hypothetical protein